ncbi:unnamed protein product [Chrysodeixis includens]|uniref:Uncharacterized protein n=1 Tax=Chrysodeixis includens TaxID=689277 RepID=A0A9N8Q2N2_CHRIL|nr:unnamed protein product [Chrysodeixis includens]
MFFSWPTLAVASTLLAAFFSLVTPSSGIHIYLLRFFFGLPQQWHPHYFVAFFLLAHPSSAIHNYLLRFFLPTLAVASTLLAACFPWSSLAVASTLLAVFSPGSLAVASTTLLRFLLVAFTLLAVFSPWPP